MVHRFLAAAFFAPALAFAADYALIDLGTLGGPGSFGAAVNNQGVVVGCADVSVVSAHAFAWKEGRMQDLGGVVGTEGSSCALAVNDHGAIAGRTSTREVVVWDGGAARPIGVRGDVGAINDRGVVVGGYEAGGTTRAFVYERGTLMTLPALGDPAAPSVATSINSHGVVVGRSGGHAFRYEDGAMRDLGTLGGNNSGARDINDRGVIVGGAANATGQPTAFVQDGAMRAIPGGTFATAIAINNRGQVVGSSEGRFGWVADDEGFTWLGDLPAVASRGWRRVEPSGINDHGWIVGTATNAEGNLRAILLVPSQKARGKPLRLVG